MKLVSLEQTCGACPSQWEGKLEDGRFVYARYRYGHLAVTAADSVNMAIMPVPDDVKLSEATDDELAAAREACHYEILADVQLGGPWDGDLSESEMLKHAGLEV